MSDMDLVHEVRLALPGKNVLQVFASGSSTYGTWNSGGLSDRDAIVVVANKEAANAATVSELAIDTKHDGKLDLHIYQLHEFEEWLASHDIRAIEATYHTMLGSPPELELILNNFHVNNDKLRHAISRAADHAWVKAKKKLIVDKDRNIYLAKKSLFHALRILSMGIELAGEPGHISTWNYRALYDEVMSLPEDNVTLQGWEVWTAAFKPRFNALATRFKQLAPKKNIKQ